MPSTSAGPGTVSTSSARLFEQRLSFPCLRRITLGISRTFKVWAVDSSQRTICCGFSWVHGQAIALVLGHVLTHCMGVGTGTVPPEARPCDVMGLLRLRPQLPELMGF